MPLSEERPCKIKSQTAQTQETGWVSIFLPESRNCFTLRHNETQYSSMLKSASVNTKHLLTADENTYTYF